MLICIDKPLESYFATSSDVVKYNKEEGYFYLSKVLFQW